MPTTEPVHRSRSSHGLMGSMLGPRECVCVGHRLAICAAAIFLSLPAAARAAGSDSADGSAPATQSEDKAEVDAGAGGPGADGDTRPERQAAGQPVTTDRPEPSPPTTAHRQSEGEQDEFILPPWVDIASLDLEELLQSKVVSATKSGPRPRTPTPLPPPWRRIRISPV